MVDPCALAGLPPTPLSIAVDAARERAARLDTRVLIHEIPSASRTWRTGPGPIGAGRRASRCPAIPAQRNGQPEPRVRPGGFAGRAMAGLSVARNRPRRTNQEERR